MTIQTQRDIITKMSDATVQLIVALLTVIGALGSAYWGAKKAGDVAEAKQDARIEETKLLEQVHHEQTIEAIERLEKKQDRYNNLQERTHELETKVEVLEAKYGT